MKAAKTRFVPPYKKSKNGTYRTNIPHLQEGRKQSGVYFIKSLKTGKIIYIGFSASQLYTTIFRHFQIWNDRSHARFVYSKTKYLVRVIFTTPKRAAVLEKYLIKKYMPRDNKDKLTLDLSQSQDKQAKQIINDCPFLTQTDDCPF